MVVVMLIDGKKRDPANSEDRKIENERESMTMGKRRTRGTVAEVVLGVPLLGATFTRNETPLGYQNLSVHIKSIAK